MKTCSKCGASKDESEFSGRSVHCKKCKCKYTKEYGVRNKEAIAARKAKHRAENKERIAAYMAAYYVETKETTKERRRSSNLEYYNKNKVLITAMKRQYMLGRRATACDEYCATLLGVKVSEVPKELLEVKRMNLLIKRHIKENT